MVWSSFSSVEVLLFWSHPWDSNGTMWWLQVILNPTENSTWLKCMSLFFQSKCSHIHSHCVSNTSSLSLHSLCQHMNHYSISHHIMEHNPCKITFLDTSISSRKCYVHPLNLKFKSHLTRPGISISHTLLLMTLHLVEQRKKMLGSVLALKTVRIWLQTS